MVGEKIDKIENTDTTFTYLYDIAFLLAYLILAQLRCACHKVCTSQLVTRLPRNLQLTLQKRCALRLPQNPHTRSCESVAPATPCV